MLVEVHNFRNYLIFVFKNSQVLPISQIPTYIFVKDTDWWIFKYRIPLRKEIWDCMSGVIEKDNQVYLMSRGARKKKGVLC